jgi:hypothetical protein
MRQVEDILPVEAFVGCKTAPPSYFFCKTDILWVVPFLQNWGDVKCPYFCPILTKFGVFL